MKTTTLAAAAAIGASTFLLGCANTSKGDGTKSEGINLRSVAGTLKDIKCAVAQGQDLYGAAKRNGDVGTSQAAGCNDSDTAEPSRATAPPPAASPAPVVTQVVVAPPLPVVSCGQPHSISIQNVELKPGEVRQGAKLEGIRLKYHTDRNGECRTRFLVKDNNNVVLASVLIERLEPGSRWISLPVAGSYKFNPRNGCFTVQANSLATANTPVDASRTECVQPVKGKLATFSLAALTPNRQLN